MSSVPDQILDPPDDILYPDVPDGLTVIKELSNQTASIAVADEIYEDSGNGRTFLDEIVRHALNNDALATYDTVRRLIKQAGETKYAQDEWKRETDWVEGDA